VLAASDRRAQIGAAREADIAVPLLQDHARLGQGQRAEHVLFRSAGAVVDDDELVDQRLG